MIARLEFRIPAVDHAHEFNHPAIDDFPVGRFDKSKLIDARIAGQRRDQSDVRTFRRLNRTDAAVVSWVHVTDFKSRPLTAEATGPERGQTSFVRNLRQWNCMINKLRLIGRTKEITTCC